MPIDSKMTKQSTIRCILSLALIAYLVFAISYTGKEAKATPFAGIDVVIKDSAGLNFVTPDDILDEISNTSGKITTLNPTTLNTDSLELYLNSIDKIETANCVVMKGNRLHIDIVPMRPVARVFDTSGASYYINTDGKRMSADIRYHIDVPVVIGSFGDTYDTKTLIPLLEYIKNNSTWNSLVTSVNVAPSQDIFLVPAIRGHVINFGDTSLIEDKFSRLHKMYNKVMPVKGWEYYDTLSVKWKGQIVATRAKKKTHSELTIICTTDTADIVDDIETMTATPTPQQ